MFSWKTVVGIVLGSQEASSDFEAMIAGIFPPLLMGAIVVIYAAIALYREKRREQSRTEPQLIAEEFTTPRRRAA